MHTHTNTQHICTHTHTRIETHRQRHIFSLSITHVKNYLLALSLDGSREHVHRLHTNTNTQTDHRLRVYQPQTWWRANRTCERESRKASVAISWGANEPILRKIGADIKNRKCKKTREIISIFPRFFAFGRQRFFRDLPFWARSTELQVHIAKWERRKGSLSRNLSRSL